MAFVWWRKTGMLSFFYNSSGTLIWVRVISVKVDQSLTNIIHNSILFGVVSLRWIDYYQMLIFVLYAGVIFCMEMEYELWVGVIFYIDIWCALALVSYSLLPTTYFFLDFFSNFSLKSIFSNGPWKMSQRCGTSCLLFHSFSTIL